MERDSTKHSARLDDALKSETESLERGAPVEARKEEFREAEPAADGEPVPAEVLGPDGAAARAELSRHLRLSIFPADRAKLLREADTTVAPDNVVATLERLPDDRTYATVYEIWSALGGEVEQAAGRPHR